MTNIQCCPIPITPNPPAEGFSYLEAMYHLCEIASQRLNPEATADNSYQTIVDNCQAIESLREKVYPQLRSKEACKTVVDRLQHFALRLHTSFFVSVCCRPSLRRDCTQLRASEKRALSDRCKTNLTETVRMFLAMHQISNIPTRSWAFTYHGLSSAVLLGILCEPKQDLEIRGLQGDLIAALSATAAKEQPNPTSPADHILKSDRDIELSGPLSRALTALRNIYDYGTLHGASGVGAGLGISRSETASGTRTPIGTIPLPLQSHVSLSGSGAGGASTPQFRGAGGQQPPAGYDRHQDAALAMTELQNGSNNLAEFSTYVSVSDGKRAMPHLEGAIHMLISLSSSSPPMSFPVSMQQTPQVGGIPDFSTVDPASLAPMELYDSIFWGKSSSPFRLAQNLPYVVLRVRLVFLS